MKQFSAVQEDVRFKDRAEPTILAPTDAIIRIAATGVRGSDLWLPGLEFLLPAGTMDTNIAESTLPL
jgi:hypothetical protein